MNTMFDGANALSGENQCAIHTSFSSNGNWPYDWSENIGCNGECFSGLVYDECGECDGDGPPDGFDCDGNCDGNDCYDCAGVLNGDAQIVTYWPDNDGDGLGDGGFSTDPAGFYPLNEDLDDYSGNDYHGDYNQSSITYTEDRFGNENSAALIDNKSDGIDIPTFNSANISISMWYKYNGTNNTWNALLSDQVGYDWHIMMSPTGNNLGSYNGSFRDTGENLQIGNWYHIVLVIEGNNRKIYLDDVIIDDFSGGTYTNVTGPLGFIGNGGNMSYGSLGSIDDVIIYNRVLEVEEISELYEGGNFTEFCDGDDPSGWVTNNADIDDTCYSNDLDCAGVCNGDAVVDECGICDSDSYNDCVQDCAGVWGGETIEDECGVCGGSGLGITSGTFTADYYYNSGAGNAPQFGTYQGSTEVEIIDQGQSSPFGPSDDFQVRWTGTILAETSGTYNFYSNTDDGARLYINNDLIIDAWFDSGNNAQYTDIYLDLGLHELVYEFYENGYGAFARLKWTPPGSSQDYVHAAAVEICNCLGELEWGCGCGAPGPSGCDNTCGSTLEFDECGVCGGYGVDADADGICDDVDDCIAEDGIGQECGCNLSYPDGACDCEGNVLDVCGVCDGDNSPNTGICDCFGVPDGDGVEDGCGECIDLASWTSGDWTPGMYGGTIVVDPSVSEYIFRKDTGGNGWNGIVYSEESSMYAVATMKVAGSDDYFMFGLDESGTGHTSWNTGTYYWYLQSDGPMDIRINGTTYQESPSSTYTQGDIFSVEADGSEIKFYHDGILKYTHSQFTGTTPLHLLANFYIAGGPMHAELGYSGEGACDGDDCPSGNYDCAGNCNGSALIDECGVCGGNNDPSTGICDCFGVPDGDGILDCAGVCGGSSISVSVNSYYQYSECWTLTEQSSMDDPFEGMQFENGEVVAEECYNSDPINEICVDTAKYYYFNMTNGGCWDNSWVEFDGERAMPIAWCNQFGFTNLKFPYEVGCNVESINDNEGNNYYPDASCIFDNGRGNYCYGTLCGFSPDCYAPDDPEECTGVWTGNNCYGGTAEEDECGLCGGDNSSCSDCADIPNGNAQIVTYWLDNDGDGLGAGESSNYCDATVPDGWAENNDDLDDACYSNDFDCAGVCDGDTVVDCLGECDGDAVVDECGVCNGQGPIFECGCTDFPVSTLLASGLVEGGSSCNQGGWGGNYIGINLDFYNANSNLFEVGYEFTVADYNYYIDGMNIPTNCNSGVALVFIATDYEICDGNVGTFQANYNFPYVDTGSAWTLYSPGVCDCNISSPDDDCDNDNVENGNDAYPQDSTRCSDTDGDTCDDCTNGSYDVANDGHDYDSDGACDAGDDDDDNDSSLDENDSDDNNPNVCSDTDGDGCDDCSSGTYNLADDGADNDSDGWCNGGDPYPDCAYDNANDSSVYPNQINVNPLDECDLCHGDGIAVGACDCAGSVLDCADICDGDGVVDECGICNGDGIAVGACDCAGNILDCFDNCGGDAIVDECGICNGDGIPDGHCDCNGNTTIDCAGVCNGDAVEDGCGDCGGNNFDDDSLVAPWTCTLASESLGCDAPYGDILIKDACPVSCGLCPCEDDDSLVAPFDCAFAIGSFGCDTPYGDILIKDACPESCNLCICEDSEACNYGVLGQCVFIGENECDCAGNVLDCFDNCGGDAAVDECGDCDGDGYVDYCINNDSCENMDCKGDCGGTAILDDCDECSGGNTGHIANSDIDCNGDCFGLAIEDGCGECSGGNTTHVANSNMDCDGICFGSAVEDCAANCSTIDSISNVAYMGNNNNLSYDADGIQLGGTESGILGYDCNGDCGGNALTIGTCGDCWGGNTGLDANYNDTDNDTICNDGAANGDIDNCPDTFNLDQANNDGDTEGDVCDADDDNDGVIDGDDCDPLNEEVSEIDCFGECGGSAALDFCGVCGIANECIPNIISSPISGSIIPIYSNYIAIEFSVSLNENSIDAIQATSLENDLFTYSAEVIDGSKLNINFSNLRSTDIITLSLDPSLIVAQEGSGLYTMDVVDSENKVWEFNVELLGDYDHDNIIDSSDIDTLIQYWGSESYEYELGPCVGGPCKLEDAPKLIPEFDAKWDIDDAMSFYVMWNTELSRQTLSRLQMDDIGIPIILQFEGNTLVMEMPEYERVVQHIWFQTWIPSNKVSFKPERFGEIFDFSFSRNNTIDKNTETWDLFNLDEDKPISRLVVGTFMPETKEDQLIEFQYRLTSKEGVLSSGSIVLNYKPAPFEFELEKVYPNPFNPTTNIHFSLPVDGEINLTLYDIQGRSITSLASGFHQAGYYETSWDGSNYSSGVYLLRLVGTDYDNIQKLILLK